MADAVSKHAGCYAQGPSGQPQAVVSVPAGTYRIAGVTFPSNLRMEVDAGATLELPADRDSVPAGTTSRCSSGTPSTRARRR